MPLPKSLARFNRHVTNRVSRAFAGHAPMFAIVEHRGRRSGREYHTPVNAFRVDGGVRFALTYGSDADWVRNVRAAGEFRAQIRGRTLTLVDPQLRHDASAAWAPPGVRQILRAIGAGDYLDCRIGGG